MTRHSKKHSRSLRRFTHKSPTSERVIRGTEELPLANMRERVKKVTFAELSTPEIRVYKIYASWCGHCKNLAPIWDNMKNQMRGAPVQFVEIEESEWATKQPEVESQIGSKIDVNGYPTIFKSSKSGVIEYYNGIRTEDEIKHWILSKEVLQGGKRKTRRARKTRRIR